MAAELRFLQTEWKNVDHESMQPLLKRLLELKEEKTYAEVAYALAMRQIVRHAHDINFVAHLLYIVDERSLPVIHLQRMTGIQQGHLYRHFKRAGVEYDATQSKAVQFDDELLAWPLQFHIDPYRRSIAIDGKEYGFDDPTCPVKVWLDEEEIWRVAYRHDGAQFPVPLPEYRRK